MIPTRELFVAMTENGRLSADARADAVEVLQECAEAVTACSAAMLGEFDAHDLAEAIGRDLDCADVVVTAARILTRSRGADTVLLSAQLEACLVACERSHETCGKHADHHAHCRICAAATLRCAEVCRRLLTALHE